MPDIYIVNPLSKDSEAKESEHKKEEGLDGGRDMSLCCLIYFLSCIPIIMGS
jgi:hypothetical protein